MIPPPLTSRALTRSEAQYSAHAATSSVRGSRSLKLSCPQRRMVAYQGGGAAAGARNRRPGAAAAAAAEHARNSRRSMTERPMMCVVTARAGRDAAGTSAPCSWCPSLPPCGTARACSRSPTAPCPSSQRWDRQSGRPSTWYSTRPVERELIELSERGLGRVRAGHEPDDGAREPQHGSPDGAVRRRGDGIQAAADPLVLGGIDRLVGLDVGVPLAVAVGVEDQRS